MQPGINYRLFIGFLGFLCLLPLEPVWANNVVKIGRGVVGDEQEKIRLLSEVAFYAGIFFSISAIGIFFAQRKKQTKPVAAAVILIIGLALILIKYL